MNYKDESGSRICVCGFVSGVLCAGVKHGIPVTIHVALGTDITHMHPDASGAAIGETSLEDFHRLATVVERLYRPLQNVVCRPTTMGGRGYQIIGHHELLLPLLFAAVREELASS